MEEGRGEKLPQPQQRFLEVSCRSSGMIRRFAAGTEAGFALFMINKKLAVGAPLALHIEAFKEGEEPVTFGPNAILVNYSTDWELQTVTEKGFEEAKQMQQISRRFSNTMTSMADVEDLDNLENAEDFDNCLHIENEDVDEQIEPKVGMEFDGIDELYDFYKKYAKGMGFLVRKQAGRKNVEGNLRSVTLSCSRAGKHESTSQNPLKTQATCRIRCTAHITARVNVGGSWLISVVVSEHNHEMGLSKSLFFRCNRRKSAHVKHQMKPK